VITLPTAASQVVVGEGFVAQLQSVYLDAGEPTQQGQRGKVAAVTLRMEASLGMMVGTNQVDGSTLNPPQIGPLWSGLSVVPDKGAQPYNSSVPVLYTGDTRVQTIGGFNTRKQVAVQQMLPYPLNVLALVVELAPGDLPQLKEVRQQRQQQARAA
jgi:hypothetical protein